MPPTQNKQHKHKKPVCKEESSSSSSSSSDIVITVEKHKAHKRHGDTSSSSSSSSSSCSSSSSSKKHKHHHRRHHHRSRTTSRTLPVSPLCKPDVCDFEELYQYYKCRLLQDESLMIGGSSAYINTIEQTPQNIPRGTPAELTTNTIQKNFDHFYPGAPFFAREDGIYILFFIATDDNTSQWSIFVNGNLQQYTTVGTNAGAGQLINRTMLALKKNDGVIVRNYISNTVSVSTAHKAGGSQTGNDLSMLIMKIAPLKPAVCREMTCEDNKCIDKKLYRKLLAKLLCDKDLMLQGFNVHGSFYTTLSQSLVAEQDVSLLDGYLANGILWNATGSNPEQLTITEDGVYKIFFVLNNNVPCQFCFCVNGVPVPTTVQGTNKGADQLTIRTILSLKANDILTVRNHSSNSPVVTTNQSAGGAQTAISVVLTIFKIAPLPPATPLPANCDSECKISEHYKCCYETFKNYLLKNEHLQLTGAPALLAVNSKDHQEASVNESLHWSYETHKRNVTFVQGQDFFVVEKTGIYDIFADIMTNEPGQFTLFLNGVPFAPTTSGRESGGNRCIMRQMMPMTKGDVVSVRNWQANAGTLNTAINPGGTEPGNSALLMMFKLSNVTSLPPCPPCPPAPCPPPTPCPPPPPTPCPPHKSDDDCSKSKSKSKDNSHCKKKKRSKKHHHRMKNVKNL